MDSVEPMKKGGKYSKKFDDYEVEGFARTLMDAEKIKADPEKMKCAKMCLAKDKKAINSIDDLKEKHQEMANKEAGYDGE